MSLGCHFPVAANGAAAGVEARKEDRTARSADAGAAVGLHVACAFFGKLIETRGLSEFLAIDTEIALGDVVAEDENEVGLFGGGTE